MSSRYISEYRLRNHRKDQFIDWIKAFFSMPFMLHAVTQNNQLAHDKYKNIFLEIENLVREKVNHDGGCRSTKIPRLDKLVNSLGTFFTPLPLADAFMIQDEKRAISSRIKVPPSFNDIRHILNTAQLLALARSRDLRLITFDGDVTLYKNGGSLVEGDRAALRVFELLKMGLHVAVVTAAGYTEAENYELRLAGLIKLMESTDSVPIEIKQRLCLIGGQSNFLFRYYEHEGRGGLEKIDESLWGCDAFVHWDQADIKATLDLAEKMFYSFKTSLNLPPETKIVRKSRSVGIVMGEKWDPESKCNVSVPFFRETLQEIVSCLQAELDNFEPSKRIVFNCFDGGEDVWCDIGAKDLGIRILQHFCCPENPMKPTQSLHIGDQFEPIGSGNDFKARLAASTVWISSPIETISALDELILYKKQFSH